MAYNLPTVPGDKKDFFRRRLIREISNLFVWDGLEDLSIPVDRIEYDLITLGRLMFFTDDKYGYIILPANATGYNLYSDPVMSRAITPQGSEPNMFGEKRIIYNYTPEVDDLSVSCVLLDNMLYGESLYNVIDFYSTRLAMVWASFDTNLIWQNIPPIISVQNQDTRLSVEKALNDIWEGKPVVIKDEALKFTDETVQSGLIDVKMILKELFDSYTEIYNDFKEYVGIQGSAVDKQSGVSDIESSSNKQHVRTALQVMLSQRQKFCRLVNRVYGLNLSVDVQTGLSQYDPQEQEEDDGNSDNRTSKLFED